MQITDSRFGRYLNSLNREPKSVVLGFCLDKDWKSSNDIKRAYLELVESKALTSTESNFSEYCHYSLLPSGFVKEKKLPVEQTFGYATLLRYSNHWHLTDEGINIGKPAAILGLEATKRFKVSSYQVLGHRPYNRAKILLHLSGVKSARAKDLAEVTESSPTGVFCNCEKLAEIGFIDYSSCSEKGWSKYEWIGKEGQLKTVKQLLTATKGVAKFMKENSGSWDYSAVASEIGQNVNSVSTVLSGLEEQGFTRKLKEFKVREKQSEASIRDLGLEFTEAFLRPVYEASDPIADRRYLEGFVGNLELSRDDIVEAIKLYYKISPPLNDMPRGAVENSIIELAREAKAPGLRPREIKVLTGKNRSDHLRRMINTGLLVKETDGKASYYSLPKVEQII